MTPEEARKVAEIMLEADGQCYICGGELLGVFARMFPEHLEVARAVYQEAGHSWEAWRE